MTWTTKLSDIVPEVLDRYGVKEIYVAYFTPVNYPGIGPAVSLGLPECELQLVKIGNDGEPVAIINRPKVNRNIKQWIRTACQTAAGIEHAGISFNCDTPEQLEYALKLAPRWLPGYERAPLERMERPEARSKAGLS